MDYCDIKQKEGSTTKGPGKCLCKTLGKGEQCLTCDEIERDWIIYNAMIEDNISQELGIIHLEEGKDVPVGQIDWNQKQLLHELLEENRDLFARSMEELKQTNVGEHTIITEDIHPIKKNAYRTDQKKTNS